MESKIAVIVAFVLAIAILTDGFSYFFVRQPVLKALNEATKMQQVSPTVSPTFEPTVTATPTAALKSQLNTLPATRSSK